MDADPTDADLVRHVGSGHDAEAEFCRRMAPRIRLYGLRHLRNPHAAEDLAQQVLIIALEALRAGRLLEQFGRDPAAPVEPTLPPLDRDRLAECLRRLKERERTVVVMTFYDEQTGAAVAGVLGVSEANVRVIRHRAIASRVGTSTSTTSEPGPTGTSSSTTRWWSTRARATTRPSTPA